MTSSRDAQLAALHRRRAAIDLEIAELLDGGGDRPGPVLAEEEMLTVAEAAPILKVTTNAVYSLIQEGKLPCVRLSPRRLRLQRSELLAWLGRQEGAHRRKQIR